MKVTNKGEIVQALIFPETDSWLDQRVVLIVLKFLAEKGLKDGLMPLKPIKIEIDGIEVTYEQLQNIDPRTAKEIKITRPDKDDEMRPF